MGRPPTKVSDDGKSNTKSEDKFTGYKFLRTELLVQYVNFMYIGKQRNNVKFIWRLQTSTSETHPWKSVLASPAASLTCSLFWDGFALLVHNLCLQIGVILLCFLTLVKSLLSSWRFEFK